MRKYLENMNDNTIQDLKDCSEVRSADPPIPFYYQIPRIRGPGSESIFV